MRDSSGTCRGLVTVNLCVVFQIAGLLLAGAAAAAPTAPAASANTPVSAAEVTALVQSFGSDPSFLSKIATNPKRLPLLLGAIQRDPAGPWAGFLYGYCYQADRTAPANQVPGIREQTAARAIGYLSSARAIVAKALQADARNPKLVQNVDLLDRAITQARSESNPKANTAPTTAGPGPRSNQVAGVGSRPPTGALVQNARVKICGSNLTQIYLAKKMWQTDNRKPQEATPAAADLIPYFTPDRTLPRCPNGGTYRIGSLRENPHCSVPGHELPKPGQ